MTRPLDLVCAFASLLFVPIPSSEGSPLLEQLSLVYKDTYVVYGPGRRSERDLPVCESAYEACNLAHTRPWLTPITERLCRCPRRTQCPLNYDERHPLNNSQHVSNRSQLKFCEALDSSFSACTSEVENPALEVLQKRTPKGGPLTRTSLFCRCEWPNAFVLKQTTNVDANTSILLYQCKQLPRTTSGSTCGHVRQDTYGVYYTHACPAHHLCVFKEPLSLSTNQVEEMALLHFQGESYEAVCTHE